MPTTATARPSALGYRVAMAGGRGGPGRGRDEPPESYPQRQEHELQALEAIYGADFQDLRPAAGKSVGTWLARAVLGWCGPGFPLCDFPPARPGLALPTPSHRALFTILQSCSPSRFHPRLLFVLAPALRGLRNPHLGRILSQPFVQVGSSVLTNTSHFH